MAQEAEGEPRAAGGAAVEGVPTWGQCKSQGREHPHGIASSCVKTSN